MSEQQSSYRQIFKATSIFGGVQVFNILVSIVRSKVAALFLGTEGFGIVGLFNSTLDMVRNITSLGINQSAVRDISEAAGCEDEGHVRSTVTMVRFWYWITGFLGMFVVLVLSPYLSEWTFGNRDYTWSFVFLSVIPLLTSISAGQLAILQGLRQLKRLALSNLYGGAIGLVFLIPFYYYWGIRGIVPYLIVASLISLLLSWYYVRRLRIASVVQSWRTNLRSGTHMMKLGIMLTVAGTLGTGVGYLIRIFISRTGGLDDVGLFTAGFSLIDTYIGLVFTAMGTDFYPRLSAVNRDNAAVSQLVNHQAEVGVLILSPMLVAFMLFAPVVLTILYSSKFVPITGMIQWAILGVLLKASSWPMAFVLLAKAETKLYFIQEVFFNFYNLLFIILGYYWFGLVGLGIGSCVVQLAILIQICTVVGYKYGISFVRDYFRVLLPCYVLCVFMFGVVRFCPTFWGYVAGIPLIVLSCWFTYRELDKRIGIKAIIKSKLRRE